MSFLYPLIGFCRDIAVHPIASRDKMKAFGRMLRWQIAARLMRSPIVVPFVDDTVLVMEVGMTGATANYYYGLLEFEDMCFAAHFLRPGDLFADVGGNVGTYSVLAAGRGASVVTFEPVPATGRSALRNFAINGFGDRVKLLNAAVGEQPGVARMAIAAYDAVSHVARADEAGIEVELVTLDCIFDEKCPVLMKIDVEGFEYSALRGAKRLLSNPDLAAIIIEIWGESERYGRDTADIDRLLQDGGFKPYRYDPLTRLLSPGIKTSRPGNFIYVRNAEATMEKVKASPPLRILNYSI
jgi:FkbM family methyltransferase